MQRDQGRARVTAQREGVQEEELAGTLEVAEAGDLAESSRLQWPRRVGVRECTRLARTSLQNAWPGTEGELAAT